VRVLVTGGAGFVGSRIALAVMADHPGAEVVALDNLRRRGAETNLSRLSAAGVTFVHGDVRVRADLDQVSGSVDVVVDASAEASVLAGLDGSPGYVLQTNLLGTINLLEWARGRVGALLFLSTSRVYSIAPLRDLALVTTGSRYELAPEQDVPGAGPEGVAEDFPTDGPRSFYGASKLASEMIVQEYADSYGLPAVITRCGVITGAGQFGKSEQGVFAMWAANHVFGKPLRYIGFDGEGRQVRDLMHPEDLYDLMRRQLADIDRHAGRVFNAGGGRAGSVSLRELTDICREAAGREVSMSHEARTSPVDIPFYISDHSRATRELGWRPTWTPRAMMREIVEWVRDNEDLLRPVFA
jgi:CDP-paratose 2-epimerase